jgi:WRKY transcription factor 22
LYHLSHHFTKSQRLLLSFSSKEKHQPHIFADFVSLIMEEDWDLHAVVRGCSTVTSTTSTTAATSSVFPLHPESSSGFSSIFGGEQKAQILSLSAHPFEPRSSSIEELHELCKPFFSRSQPISLQSSPLFSSFSYSSASPKLAQTQHKQQEQQQRSKQLHQGGSVTNPRSKRR